MARGYQDVRTFAQPKQIVFDAAQRAIPTVGKMRVRNVDPANGRIDVTKGVSLKSWGESITVDVQEAGPNESTVRVGSRVRAQLVDWGVNKQKVDTVLNAISLQLGG